MRRQLELGSRIPEDRRVCPGRVHGDVKAKKLAQQLKAKGYGRLGEYGDASAVWQGPYHAIWTFESRLLTTKAGI